MITSDAFFAGKSDAPTIPIRVRAPIALPISIESTRYINDLVHAKRRNGRDIDSTKYLLVHLTMSTRMESKRMSGSSINRHHEQRELDLTVHTAALILKHTADTQRIVPANNSPEKMSAGPRVPQATSSRTSIRHSFTKSILPKNRQIASIQPTRNTAVGDAQDALQTLSHSEHVVMAEYIECAIPVLYGVYLGFLYHLPTAANYPHTRSLTPGKFVTAQKNLFLYSLVELVSLVGLTFMLKRKLSFSPIYQPAFVLETQLATLQGHLFLWISVILQMTLAHNGTLDDAYLVYDTPL
ncbi:unnamed protein product [Phytophthora lilii]|uniref:Unnamed protein product n=1 Tax=Phytophthora lilii TaxID=2077276 RepID=A0A9W6UEB3_9STRA|nr:unnamed protein product [Phytophthora lilii]